MVVHPLLSVSFVAKIASYSVFKYLVRNVTEMEPFFKEAHIEIDVFSFLVFGIVIYSAIDNMPPKHDSRVGKGRTEQEHSYDF